MRLPCLSRPIIADRRAGKVAGIACTALGMVLLWDAYTGHGERPPIYLRPFMPFS